MSAVVAGSTPVHHRTRTHEESTMMPLVFLLLLLLFLSISCGVKEEEEKATGRTDVVFLFWSMYAHSTVFGDLVR